MAKRSKGDKVRTGVLTKVLILALLAGVGFQLHQLRGQVAAAEAERAQLENLVAVQRQENDALQEDIAEGPTEEKMRELAREELDLVAPGDRIFYVNN